jgi:hypothetical protein
MAGFRLKSLPRLRQIQQEKALGRLADAQRHATAEQRGAAHEPALLEKRGVTNVLAAAGLAGPAAAPEAVETRSAEAVAAGEVRAAEQALLLAVQARRRAERLRDGRDPSMRALAGQADEQGLDEFAATAHDPAGEPRAAQ